MESVMKTRTQEIAQAAMTLYQIYPKHVGRAAALKAIRKALSREPYEVLLEATEAYAAAIAWQEWQFIPHPATWFNQERYHDDRECWKAPKPNGYHHSREATEAYLHAKKAVKEFGIGWQMRFKDKAIEAAIREIGGWRKFCDWPSHESAVRQREFEKAYD